MTPALTVVTIASPSPTMADVSTTQSAATAPPSSRANLTNVVLNTVNHRTLISARGKCRFALALPGLLGEKKVNCPNPSEPWHSRAQGVAFEDWKEPEVALIAVQSDVFRLAQVFTISRGSRTEARVLTVSISREGLTGRGECVPYGRYGETLESVQAQIESLPDDITRETLQSALPAGAARNAVDCALWDLAAKQSGRRVWQLADLPEPGPMITAYTLSLDSPDNMRIAAAKNADRPLLKIKLGTADDMPRLEAVRQGAPKTAIIIDANEGWSADVYSDLAPHLIRLGVGLVEQPLPAGADDMLAEIARPLPVCADESCHDRHSLAALTGKYDVVNIKLDKTGGLTEALALKTEALAQGYGLMVGCMVGSSLAMAPATLLAQGAAYVDLDGPLLLAEDRDSPLCYDERGVYPPTPALWG
jgi:L-alanine-DL-glutamate epimerase-like enolase superfamily enzyme